MSEDRKELPTIERRSELVEKFRKMTPDEKIELLMETVMVQASENDLLRTNFKELNRNMQNLEREIKKNNDISAPRKVGAVNAGFLNDEERKAEDGGEISPKRGVTRFH